MSEPELLFMSLREWDRLKVLPEVQRGQLRQKQAAQLGSTDRWVRKLLGRLRREDDRGVVHRSRGRPSKRQLPAAWREQVVAQVKDSYRDFGPPLAREYLAKRDGIPVSKETLRQWASGRVKAAMDARSVSFSFSVVDNPRIEGK